MSITVVKEKGATVVTVTSHCNNSAFPPLCQILKHLCYSPVCCSVQKGLIRNNVTVALGVVQLMVGLFNVALGPGRTSTHPGDLSHLGAAYWLGAVYIAGGAASILSSQYPSLCSVGFAVFVNIVGSIFATFGIVLYALDLSDASIMWMCDRIWTSSPNNYDDNCRHVAFFAQKLLVDMDVTLIVLAVLHLCVSISFAVLAGNALFSRKKEKKGASDVQIEEPLLKEILLTSPCA